MTLFMIIIAAAKWSNARYAMYVFSNLTRSFLKRLNHECATSTIHRFGLKPCSSVVFFFSARSDMRFHSMGHDKLRFSDVSCVQAEILLNGLDMSEVQGDDTVPQEFVKHRTVVPVGSGCDERQRDAICVHQYILFASVFFPYP